VVLYVVAMEKVVALLVGDASGDVEGLTDRLLGPAADELRRRGGSRLQVNVVDPELGPPHGVPPDPDVPSVAAVLSYWVAAAGEVGIHAECLPVHEGWAWHAYLVSEALQLHGPPPPPGGGRCQGFTQIVPLSVPPALSWAEWRRRWQGEHTRVAVETQSSFRYVQNLVVRPFSAGAPAFAAIVEESFPLAAAADPTVFYDSEGDDAKFQSNLARMMDSCARFIAGSVPITWTAEYRPQD
jgi:hypothetical protein